MWKRVLPTTLVYKMRWTKFWGSVDFQEIDIQFFSCMRCSISGVAKASDVNSPCEAYVYRL